MSSSSQQQPQSSSSSSSLPLPPLSQTQPPPPPPPPSQLSSSSFLVSATSQAQSSYPGLAPQRQFQLQQEQTGLTQQLSLCYRETSSLNTSPLMPLPSQQALGYMIYVNPKQYYRIQKRRAARARMNEAMYTSIGAAAAVETSLNRKKAVLQKRQAQASKRKRNSFGQFI